MAAQTVAEARDSLELIHLRLAISETEPQLQEFTNNSLLVLIQMISHHPELVSKVQEILNDFNRRVRNNLAIRLPALDMLKALPNASPSAKALSLLYLHMSKNRMSAEEHLEVLPCIMMIISENHTNKDFCYELLPMAMPGIVALSKIEKMNWPKLFITPDAQPVILRFFQMVMVLDCALGVNSIAYLTGQMAEPTAVSTHVCLSAAEFVIVAKKVVVPDTTFVPFKLAVIKVCTEGFLDEIPSFSLYVLGLAQNNNAIEDASSSALKKVDLQKCVDHPNVVDQLMFLYLGDSSRPGERPPNAQVCAASMRIKQFILPYLTRSALAPVRYMNNIKICNDILDPQFSKMPKVQTAGLQFVLKVINEMPPSALLRCGNMLFSKLKTTEQMNLESASHALVFRCMGQLGKSVPSLILSDFEILTHLFDAIDMYEEVTAYAAVQCLVAWLPVFCDSSALVESSITEDLKKLVAAHVVHDNAKARLVALKYIEAFLSPGEMDVKWLLLNSAGDSRDEIRGEATRLLELSLRTAAPDITFAANFISDMLSADIKSMLQISDTELPTAETSKKVPHAVHQMCSRYLWALCEKETGFTPELRIVEGDEHWRLVAPKVGRLIASLDSNVAMRMTAIALIASRDDYDVHVFRIATCFVFASSFSHRQTLISTSVVVRTRNATRSELSSCTSLLAAKLLNPQAQLVLFNQSFEELKTKPLAGLCWLAASAVCLHYDVTVTIPLAKELHLKLIELAEEGYQRTGTVLEAALGALAVILRRFHSEDDLGLSDAEFDAVIATCEKIAASRKDSLPARAREAAVEVIGLLVTTSDAARMEKARDSLYNIGAGPPQPELQLIVGAALWDSCLGPLSTSRRNPYVEAEADKKLPKSDESAVYVARISNVLNSIMNEKLNSGNHHVRRAALVWLLVMVQKCETSEAGCLDAILDDIQGAFADGLTENDDFSQDIASKGMGVVYQMASAEQRKSLVAGLMTSIAEGRRSSAKVQGDTVLFKEGQLGKSPDGSSLTTYKELCSLATDLNQPDLVYKFMQLAKHNATWNAKKGAAFGFGAILEQAREELDPYIGQLVPKLYRYRFDPDPKVQQSMRSIWTSIAQSRRSLVEQYADEIFNDIYPQLTHKEWRVRESCCLALSDLIQTNDTPMMHSRLPETLECVLRVRDDVKESVRLAAERAGDSLQKLSLRLASSSNKEKSEEFLTKLLPVVIEKGVHSSIKSNKAFCLNMLFEMVKVAGPQLRPYLAELIPILLDAISESEHTVLNYIAARSNTSQLEALDDARSQMARTSPIMSAITDLVPQINNDVIVGVYPRLCEQLRASVGVSTRAAASSLISQLTMRAPQLLLDHQYIADKFFGALLPGVRDRNPSIRKNFANTMSYLAKFVTSNQILELVKQIATDLTSEIDDMKQSSRHVLSNLVDHSPEIVQGYASDIVPYVFLETCKEVIKGDDESKKRHDEWNTLWESLVPSTNGAVRLYRPEIVKLATDVLRNNAVWSVRAQAARMLAKTAETMGEGLDVTAAADLIDTLLPLLSGRFWNGKESILVALAAVFNSSGSQLMQVWKTENVDAVLLVLQREANKKNKDYSAAALWCWATFAAVTKNIDAANALVNKVDAGLQKALDPTADASSDDEGLSNIEKEAQLVKFVTSQMLALVKVLEAYREGKDADDAVGKLRLYLTNSNVYWKARQDTVVALLTTVTKWKLSSPVASGHLIDSLFSMADEMCDQKRPTIAYQCLSVVLKMAERGSVFTVDWSAVIKMLSSNNAAKETGLATRLLDAMKAVTTNENAMET